jgi:hypothetical protein
MSGLGGSVLDETIGYEGGRHHHGGGSIIRPGKCGRIERDHHL